MNLDDLEKQWEEGDEEEELKTEQQAKFERLERRRKEAKASAGTLDPRYGSDACSRQHTASCFWHSRTTSCHIFGLLGRLRPSVCWLMARLAPGSVLRHGSNANNHFSLHDAVPASAAFVSYCCCVLLLLPLPLSLLSPSCSLAPNTAAAPGGYCLNFLNRYFFRNSRTPLARMGLHSTYCTPPPAAHLALLRRSTATDFNAEQSPHPHKKKPKHQCAR